MISVCNFTQLTSLEIVSCDWSSDFSTEDNDLCTLLTVSGTRPSFHLKIKIEISYFPDYLFCSVSHKQCTTWFKCALAKVLILHKNKYRKLLNKGIEVNLVFMIVRQQVWKKVRKGMKSVNKIILALNIDHKYYLDIGSIYYIIRLGLIVYPLLTYFKNTPEPVNDAHSSGGVVENE